eukprot:SAG31_NODE_2900_length_4934_cov_2.001448_8_plen_87_part_00
MEQFMVGRHHGQEPQTLGQAFCQTISVIPGLLLGTSLFAMLLADSNLERQTWKCPSSHGDLAGALIFPAKVCSTFEASVSTMRCCG